MDLSDWLPVAVRVWTTDPKRPRKPRKAVSVPPISHVLMFDTETTVDPSQALLFGAFRYCRVDRDPDGQETLVTVAEGLIYADDLAATDPAGYQLLQDYAQEHRPSVDLDYPGVEPTWQLQLLSRTEFVKRWLWHVGYPHNERRDPAMIVAFNMPFDLSRIAVDVAEARDDMYGGFSLIVFGDPDGTPWAWKPRVAVKALDSKRALKKFRRLERNGKQGAELPPWKNHAGHLLDLRTLVFALTGKSHSLDSACKAYQVPGKSASPEFGVISVEAVDYCRQDVAATTGLYEAAMADFQRHPIQLQATKAYSPASVGKAYLRAMGIKPRLDLDDIDPKILGYAMAAFYGGRAEVHVRKTPLPVRLVDFTSMYPTVDTLMGVWAIVTASKVDIVDATSDVQAFLDTVSVVDLYNPQTWPQMLGFGAIIPDGDVVPVRAGYREGDWSIGVNPLHAETPFWYTIPDLIASKILTGKTPTVTRAYRLIASDNRQTSLRSVMLKGEIRVDPARDDFYKTVVEQKQTAKAAAAATTASGERTRWTDLVRQP